MVCCSLLLGNRLVNFPGCGFHVNCETENSISQHSFSFILAIPSSSSEHSSFPCVHSQRKKKSVRKTEEEKCHAWPCFACTNTRTNNQDVVEVSYEVALVGLGRARAFQTDRKTKERRATLAKLHSTPSTCRINQQTKI